MIKKKTNMHSNKHLFNNYYLNKHDFQTIFFFKARSFGTNLVPTKSYFKQNFFEKTVFKQRDRTKIV
jgi:hypothetical protein